MKPEQTVVTVWREQRDIIKRAAEVLGFGRNIFPVTQFVYKYGADDVKNGEELARRYHKIMGEQFSRQE